MSVSNSRDTKKQSTLSRRSQVGGKSDGKRDNVVMVRVGEEDLNRIDELVESGQFKSRSEATAYLISEGIKARKHMFDRMKEKISQIHSLRMELEQMLAEDPELADLSADERGTKRGKR